MYYSFFLTFVYTKVYMFECVKIYEVMSLLY